MKLLLDFLPIVLFFAAFKWAEANPEVAAAWASQNLGPLVSAGQVSPALAPLLLATVVVVAASSAQVAWSLARGRRVDPLLWLSLGLVVVLGAATVWFHNETFIKWKPTALYGLMAAALVAGPWIFQRNLLRAMMGQQMRLPDAVWAQLNWAWVSFFAAMALLNLWVAYTFETATWVSFKLFGGIGLLLAFALAQGVWVSRHIEQDTPPSP